MCLEANTFDNFIPIMSTFKISNIVAMIQTKTRLDLDSLIDLIQVNEYVNFVQYCPTMFGSTVMGAIIRRGKNSSVKKNRSEGGKLFRNQILVQGKSVSLPLNISYSTIVLNRYGLKIFKNGTITFVGFKSIDDIPDCAQYILNVLELQSIHAPLEICSINATIKTKQFLYSMIPSLVRTIRDRLKLSILLYSRKCKKGESTVKQIRVTFYFNEMYATDGCCHCGDKSITCDMKGNTGKSLGDCRSITVIMYATGTAQVYGVTSMYELRQIDQFFQLNVNPIISTTPDTTVDDYFGLPSSPKKSVCRKRKADRDEFIPEFTPEFTPVPEPVLFRARELEDSIWI